MAYSQVGIINLGYSRIGVTRISTLTEDTEQRIAATTIWEYIRDLVLEASDWRFAKTRAILAQLDETPVYGYNYAYALPADFLRLCLQKESDPPIYPSGAYSSAWTAEDVTILSRQYGYIIEALEDGTLCLFSDYDDSGGDPLYITYIRREVDPAKYTAHFVSTFAFRLASELALTRTESRPKFADMMILYDAELIKAEGLNRSSDYLKDETGADSWETAGRI
jgi:hypothetical protein